MDERRKNSSLTSKNTNIRQLQSDRYRKSINTKQRKKSLMLKRIKAGILFALIIAIFVFVLLMTPLFNIRKIAVNGNNVVSISQIESSVGDLVGKNLIRCSKADVFGRLSQNPYIKDCKISKNLFSATLYIDITENIPAGHIVANGTLLVIDSKLNVIDDTNSIKTDAVPQIMGIDSVKYRLGSKLKISDSEKESALSTILSIAEETKILHGITRIDIGNTLDISFDYENRLVAKCGTSLNLEQKMRMFKETVTSASLSPDSTGTIILSNPGKATFTPENTSAEILSSDNTDEDNETKEAEE